MQQLVRDGSTRQLAWRQLQLNNLEALLQELETPLRAALATDLGKPAVEAFFEIVGVQGELKLAKKQLKRWMAPRRVALPAVQQPGRTTVAIATGGKSPEARSQRRNTHPIHFTPSSE